MQTLEKNFEFELPVGYVDEKGINNKKRLMRLATKDDEIIPLKDPRVHENPSYLSIIILARVDIRLGSLEMINTRIIENLDKKDLEYLIKMYNRINDNDMNRKKIFNLK